ncbi:MAG TPA: indole-3-glycerol phosphate synthase TrpC [Phycisphaerales bacterium]|nr:indole-3-glycerol phosphate synthase TrpC [Phycisphaerales bacterium]HCD35201.1 indole-3-glycerol phosphate synthase TrpC [Phycisphaerales bacterium]|tara:strand:- start:851 stop:1663 length:813 start_codon:yes stop_codon:yes gene_type:complete
MADILANIIVRKQRDLLDLQKKVSFEQIQGQLSTARPPRDFFAAMTQPVGQLCVLSEVKKASPSAGLIRADFDAVAIAKAYEANGASAISCLTDEPFFQGSLDYLTAISETIDLPVMRKDFIIDPYQVVEARVAGADALLLIAECLDDQTLYALHKLTGELGMGCLLEIFDPANLDRAQNVIADQPGTPTLLGINNRDLKAMVTHLDHTLDLLPHIDNLDTLVSESGIKTGEDVRKLRKAGVHRILIGEHLMRQPDPGIALAKLITDSDI